MFQKTTLTCIIGFLFINFIYSQNKDTNTLLNKGLRYRYTQPKLSIRNFNECYQIAIYQKDTLMAVESLINLANIYSHNVDYNKAYDHFWKALLLAEKQKNKLQQARIYQELGWLYSYYNRDQEALKYFNFSLKINKELFKNEKAPIEYVSSDYFSLTNFYRIRGNYKMFEKYLDSFVKSKKVSEVIEKNYYLEGELAYQLSNSQKYDEALEKLEEVERFFKQYDKSYLVVVYYLIADTYTKMGQYKKSQEYYVKSITHSEKFYSHSNYKILSCEALVNIYKEEDNYQQAFKYLNISKELNDRVFGSKSLSNQKLFDLKDSYRITKENEQILKRTLKLRELQQKDYILFWKNVVLIIFILFILLFGYVFIKQLRKKHRNEKRLIKEHQKQELKRQNEILELKNKELTTQALQLIEKEEFLTYLNKRLSKQKETMDVKKISRMIESVQGNPTSNWKEFEARFTQINQNFYKNLKDKFPDLGQTDQKICALIKLNFSSKEMSSLLGISVESVHTSRYRLRKKLGLDRSENLSFFINSI